MATTSERRKLIAIVAVAAAAVLIVAGGAAAVGWLAGRDVETVTSSGPTDSDAGDQNEGGDDDGADDDVVQDGEGDRQGDDGASEDQVDAELVRPDGNVVPKRMGGLEAIEELGENLEAVAKKNGMTADQLRDLLLHDSTAKVTPDGFVLFVDTATPPPSE